MTKRQEIISTLLEWYEAVRDSWNDGTGAGDYGLPMLCPVYNHPSYVELDRLFAAMKDAKPHLYRTLAERYIYAPTKVVLRCPKCGPRPERIEAAIPHPKDQIPKDEEIHHKHAGTLVRLNPVRVRLVSARFKTEHITEGIEWLDANWRGEPFIPDFETRAA